MQIMQEIALFSGKIYTAGTNFTRPSVVTVATNLNSGHALLTNKQIVIPEEDEWVEIVIFPLPMSCSIQFSVFRFKRFPLQRVRAGISAVANTHPPLGAFCTANPQHGQRRGKKERTENENQKNKTILLTDMQ